MCARFLFVSIILTSFIIQLSLVTFNGYNYKLKKMIKTALQFYDKEGIEGYKYFLYIDAIGKRNVGDAIKISSYYFPDEESVNEFKDIGFDFGEYQILNIMDHTEEVGDFDYTYGLMKVKQLNI